MGKFMSESPQFGRVRSFLWPIAPYELKKFIPMVLMIFLIGGNYNLLKIIKDSTIIPTAGAEVIPFIKVWLMFPAAVLTTAFFSLISQKLGQNRAFYIIVSMFLVYFSVFVLLIYPNRELFFPHSICDYLETILPQGFRGFVHLVRYWPLSLFYTMCEIWGTLVLFVLFWGFANRITKLHEAKRFYALLGLAGNSTGIVVPLFYRWAINATSMVPDSFLSGDWEKTLLLAFVGVILSGLISLAVFFWMNKYIIAPQQAQEKSEFKSKPKPPPLSFVDSIKVLLKSKYVLYISAIVLSYNLVINLSDVLWKAQLKALYPNSIEYGYYYSTVMQITGVLATISDLFICSNVLRRFGWTVGAMITPVIFAVTSIGFFGFVIFGSHFESEILAIFGVSSVVISVFFGSTQNALSRAAKYSLFDATKEIAYIPLDSLKRVQAKAAIDGICSRLGKSSGSMIYQALMVTLGSLTACIPVVSIIIGIIIAVWCSAVKKLGDRFNELTAANDKKFSSEACKLNRVTSDESSLVVVNRGQQVAAKSSNSL